MDEEQVVRFVREDMARVTAGLALLCGDRHLAEDAVQDALAEGLHRGQLIDDVAAWVATVALNRVRMVHRRRGAEQRALGRLGRRRAASPAEPAVADAELAAAVAALPRAQREAVVLHYLLDLSVERAAAVAGVSPGSVKTSLHRAREALRQALPAPSEEVDGAR